jgi:PPIC-type PPIASE domain
MLFNFISKYSTFLLISFVLFSCSNQDKNLELASFENDHVYQSEYIDHYLLSTQYKPDKLPTAENLKEIVLNKALEKMSVQEAISINIEKDSLYILITENNERRLLFQKYVQSEIIDSIITDSLVHKFYSEFSPQYRMKYIMRPFLRNSTEEFISSQKDEIEKAYKLLKSGEKFKEVTEKYSQDITTNKKGGDLGWIIRESMGDEALRVVMDTLTQFNYSKPFKGYGGYYIMVKGEKRDVKVPAFDSVKQKIWNTLYHSRKAFIQKAVENRFGQLVEKYDYLKLSHKELDLFSKFNNSSNTNESVSIDYEKFSEENKSVIIAEYDNGVISVEDLFANKKRAPTNREEFLNQFESISQQHLFAKHARELNLQNESELKTKLHKMKTSLLSTFLYQRLVKDKVNEMLSSNIDLKGNEKVKRRSEYENTLRTEFENKLKNKYKFKFETKNFNEALKSASIEKEIQNSEKVTK